jgi:hypothetical protein
MNRTTQQDQLQWSIYADLDWLQHSGINYPGISRRILDKIQSSSDFGSETQTFEIDGCVNVHVIEGSGR